MPRSDYEYNGRKVHVHNIEYTEAVARSSNQEWGKKCPLCGEIFNVGDKCTMVMCNGDPFGNVLVHRSCMSDWNDNIPIVFNLIEEKYRAWCKLSGIWSPTVPEAGL